MAKSKVYGIPEADRADAKQHLEEWRGARNSRQTFDVRPDHGMIVALVLARPVGFDAGLCVRLVRDPQRAFVWIITLLGYPAISGRATFRIQWSGPGTSFRSQKIGTYSTAEEFAATLPDELKKIAVVQGGTMAVAKNGTIATAQTGRWFISFAHRPEWTPTVVEMSDPRLQGRAEIHDLRPSNRIDQFRMLASISGPVRIHPGSMAMGWNHDGVLRLGPVEARIYQEYDGGPTSAQYVWSVSPFSSTVYEGDEVVFDISLTASNQDVRDGAVDISVAVAIDYGDETTAEDFEGTLDDWMAAAVEGLDAFTWAGGRLTVRLNPDDEAAALELKLRTINDAIIEGDQLFALRLSAARASQGIVLIQNAESNIRMVDKDAATFGVFGPSTTGAPTDVVYTVTIEGVFKTGAIVAVSIADGGTAIPGTDISDWAAAFEIYAATLPGVSFVASTGRLQIVAQEDGGLDALAITVGFLPSSAGKTFSLTLSAPEVVGGSAALKAGANTVETEVEV